MIVAPMRTCPSMMRGVTVDRETLVSALHVERQGTAFVRLDRFDQPRVSALGEDGEPRR